MEQKNIEQRVLEQVGVLSGSLSTHIALQKISDEKIGEMYKILVTGNGVPALPEIVRRHQEWILERDKEREENAKNRKEEKQNSIQDTKADRREAISFKHQIWLMLATEVVGFGVLGLELALHMK
jgi:hypothetical protein